MRRASDGPVGNLKKAFRLVNAMVEAGIVEKYALGGSLGAVVYTEPIPTKDVDFFIVTHLMRTKKGLVDLGGVYAFMKGRGYSMREQFFDVEGMLVDFIPATPLSEEGIDEAATKTYEGEKVRVFRPEHLIALAVESGRDKDKVRIGMLLASAAVDKKALTSILKRHGLYAKAKTFVEGMA